MRIRQILAALVVLVALTAARADAVTIRDIIELSKAGLGDDVLLALIEVDRTVFSIDTATLKMLKESGVSQPVILAMIRSGRMPTAPEPQPPVSEPIPEPVLQPSEPPQPQVIVIDHHDQPQAPVVPYVVPVFVSFPTAMLSNLPSQRSLSVNRALRVRPGNDLSPINSDLSPRPVARPPAQQCAPPLFVGFGGKLRPDGYPPAQVCR